MVAVEMLMKLSNRHKKSSEAVIKDNWHGLYQKDSQFTYPEATLIVSKSKRK
ncbi:hypothetical protein ACWOA0_03295 [Ignavigranum ruoffiae]|uniref:Uncharacterized protein n=1 Tax=Ignavigranum ruoffiae TaxID=89093 RepID=A0A1H9G446_9LACT|nr:hypothetical protein [Ignavigranum ruoffiae]UPQ86074.1 hypothetical protein M0R79_01480 [Ignavigranum ruoffiae]SEQ44945.1 hypothetical protein SAMN04488558_11128 [Ignavigranum ruoffiae]